jgi:2-desacetyl-2-hydroxyethyl bacteriochlorophyllide A dehydrogenase
MQRKALYFTSPGQVEVCAEQMPPLQPGQVLVQSLLSAISAGTEMLFYRGQFPQELPVDASIAALSAPPAYPLKYGYSLAGKVIDLGEGTDPDWLGRAVFAFHPHESHFAATPEELIPLPEGISAEQAVLLPNMETAVNFVMDGAPLIGEEVAVFGQGIVGLLTTFLLSRFPLGRLVTLDAYPLRRALSLELGAHASLDPADPEKDVQLFVNGADLCYEVSGAPQALDQAIALAGYASRVVVGSWYGTKPVHLNLGGRFHRSRMRLVSSQVSTLAPELSGRWDKMRRMGVAWEMLRSIQPSRLITQRIPFDQTGQAYELIDREPDKTVQVILDYAHH